MDIKTVKLIACRKCKERDGNKEVGWIINKSEQLN